MAAKKNKEPKRAGFWNYIDQNGSQSLRYRGQEDGDLEVCLPAPGISKTAWVHTPTGSMIDLSVQTVAVTDYATEIATDAAPATPPFTPNPDTLATKTPPA